MANPVTPPYPFFTGTDGEPLENGMIFIGRASLDPLSFPITVYWDEALTIPAEQPIRTLNGYPSRDGSASSIWTGASAYSIRVTTNHGVLVFNEPSVLVTYATQVTPQEFGAVGDNVTDDGPAFVAAIAYLKSIRVVPDVSYGAGSGDLFVPSGEYYLGTSTLDITHTMCIRGEGTGLPGASGTVLRWAAGATGIRTQTYNTSGATGARTPDSDNASGSGSAIRNMTLIGGYAGTEGEFHGIHLRAMATVENVSIYRFQGDGFHARAFAGGSPDGNVNLARVTNVLAQGNRMGFYIDGDDANAMLFLGCTTIANRQWGFEDSSFLGNTYVGCHTAADGWDGALGSTPTGCTYSGNRYYVKINQATGASTNAPTGTTADNTWWGYISAGGTYNGIVAWVSGTTFREGGCFKSDNANASNCYFGCYIENDSNPAQLLSPAMVFGGFLGTSARDFGHYIRAGGEGLRIGPNKGSIQDYALTISSTNVTQALYFDYWSGGTGTRQASIWTASGQIIYDHATSHRFRLNNVEQLSLTSSGFLVTASALGLGYGTGAGGAVTQATSRTTGVTLNKACGAITLVSAAGSAAWQSFTVTNSVVAANDTVRVCQKSGTDKNMIHVTAVGAGSFEISFATTGGTTTEQPVFNFAVVKGVAA